MRLITAPNSWSCAAASLAMVLDIDFDEVIEMIGHDGSEKINPQLRSPGCYKGFHMQELIEVALGYNYAVTPIEAMPVQTALGDDEYDVEIKRYESSEDRLQYHLIRSKGILIGKLNKYWHAVAWNSSKIYDPRGQTYPYSDCKINVATFWSFNLISNH